MERLFLHTILVLTTILLRPVISSVFIRKELVPCDSRLNDPSDNEVGNLTSCSRRLFLSIKLIQDEQLRKKYQYVVVDSAYDVTLKEEVRILTPLVVKIIQHPAAVAYPFKYMFAANNRPYEITLNKNTMANYTGCDPSAVYQPACQRYEHLAPNRGKNGKVITQGFCCPCEAEEKDNRRDNLVCRENEMSIKEGLDPQATTHCLRFDPVWYSVNALNAPLFHHKIGIGIYLAQENTESERQWKPLLPNFPSFILGTHHKRAKHQKIVASYTEITKKDSIMKLPLDHQKQLVLIPQPHISDEDFVPPQIKQGPGQFLVVDKTTVDQTGASCDKIGVSYTMFDRQLDRCHSPLNSCLQNSIQDMWIEDMKSTASGNNGKYFLSSFGNLSDPSVVEEPNSDPLLLFDMKFEHISHIYIDINADLIQTTTPKYAEIVQVVSVSDEKTTEIEVHVHNKGRVTSFFTTMITDCSSPEKIFIKRSKPVNPYGSATFSSKLEHTGTTQTSGQPHSCSMILMDDNMKTIATRVILFQPMYKCYCIAECSCKCTSQKDWKKCHRMRRKEQTAAGFPKQIHKKKPSHLKGLTSGMLFLIIILAALLFLGILKCLANVLKELNDSRGNGMYSDIRPDWREYGLRRMCLDCWFFFYCPLWMIYLCMSEFVKKFCQEEYGVQPRQAVSEVFEEVKEDKGKFKMEEPEFQSAAENRSTPGPTPNSQARGQTTDDQNENNSRWIVQSEASETENRSQCTADNTTFAPETISEVGEQPVSVSSSTSTLNKRAIELTFRKKKEFFNNLVEDPSEPPSPLGSIMTVAAGEMSQEPSERGSHYSEPGSRYSEHTELDDDPLSEEETRMLNNMSSPVRLVYLNLSEKTTILHKSGETYSLCGSLKKSGLYYKYTLGHYTTQLFWNKKGKIKKLRTPLPISAKNFVKVMTGKQALAEVTMEPKYPCLNYVPQ